jgi:uncharacterized membrane protein
MIGMEITIWDIVGYALGWLLQFSVPVSIPLVIGLLLLRQELQERMSDRMICHIPVLLLIVGVIVTVMFAAVGTIIVFTAILKWFEPATPPFIAAAFVVATLMLVPPLLSKPE